MSIVLKDENEKKKGCLNQSITKAIPATTPSVIPATFCLIAKPALGVFPSVFELACRAFPLGSEVLVEVLDTVPCGSSPYGLQTGRPAVGYPIRTDVGVP